MALWERRPSVVGKAGLEAGKRARCIMLLFSVGLRYVTNCPIIVLVFAPTGVQNRAKGKRRTTFSNKKMQMNCIAVATMLEVAVASDEDVSTLFLVIQHEVITESNIL